MIRCQNVFILHLLYSMHSFGFSCKYFVNRHHQHLRMTKSIEYSLLSLTTISKKKVEQAKTHYWIKHCWLEIVNYFSPLRLRKKEINVVKCLYLVIFIKLSFNSQFISDGPYTLLAPNNMAFAKLGNDTITKLMNNPDVLKSMYREKPLSYLGRGQQRFLVRAECFCFS
jgi:hypothetical protein